MTVKGTLRFHFSTSSLLFLLLFALDDGQIAHRTTGRRQGSATIRSDFSQITDDPVAVAVIIGGSAVVPVNRYPFMVTLQNSKGRHFCGGSILSRKRILTAAHCVVDANSGELMQANSVRIGAGILDLREKRSRFYHRVEYIHHHPNYTRSAAYANDIAVVVLQGKGLILDPATIAPILLPSGPGVVHPHEEILTAGWGAIDNVYDGPYSNHTRPMRLQVVRLRTLPHTECRKRSGRTHFDQTKICTDNKEKSTCLGDSGGPLFRKAHQGQYQLLGITSYNLGLCKKPDSASVFTKVSSFLPWLNDPWMLGYDN